MQCGRWMLGGLAVELAMDPAKRAYVGNRIVVIS